jgi:hypothetical protein
MAAQAHGGTLAVETCEGWPSSFVIHMPMAQAQGQVSVHGGKATRESPNPAIAA